LSQISFFAEIIDPAGKSLKMPLAGGEGADAGGYSVTFEYQSAPVTILYDWLPKERHSTGLKIFSSKAVEPTFGIGCATSNRRRRPQRRSLPLNPKP